MLEASWDFIFFLSSLLLSMEDRLSSHCCRIFLEDIQLSPRLSAGTAHCPPLTSVPLATSTLLVLRRSQVQFQGFPSKYRWRRRGKYSKTLRSKADILLFRKFKTWSCFKSFSSCSPTSSMSFPFRSNLARVSGSLNQNKTTKGVMFIILILFAWVVCGAEYLPRNIWNVKRIANKNAIFCNKRCGPEVLMSFLWSDRNTAYAVTVSVQLYHAMCSWMSSLNMHLVLFNATSMAMSKLQPQER